MFSAKWALSNRQQKQQQQSIAYYKTYIPQIQMIILLYHCFLSFWTYIVKQNDNVYPKVCLRDCWGTKQENCLHTNKGENQIIYIHWQY